MMERFSRNVLARGLSPFLVAAFLPCSGRAQTEPTPGTTTTTTKTTKTTTTTQPPPNAADKKTDTKRDAPGQPGKNADTKTKEKPKEKDGDQPKVNKKKTGCCACVTKLELEYLGPRHDTTKEKILNDPLGVSDPTIKPGTDVYGDEFKLKIYYRNKLVEDADDNGELSLEWFETTSRYLYGESFPIGQPTDVLDWLRAHNPAGLEGPTFHSWIHRKTAKADCPAPPPGQLLMPHIEIGDLPRTIVGASRTLEFKFVVKSAPKCKSKEEKGDSACQEKLELTAKQVLEKGGSGKSTFYGPSGAPMTPGQTVKVP